jgi:hypothetical protein
MEYDPSRLTELHRTLSLHGWLAITVAVPTVHDDGQQDVMAANLFLRFEDGGVSEITTNTPAELKREVHPQCILYVKDMIPKILDREFGPEEHQQ